MYSLNPPQIDLISILPMAIVAIAGAIGLLLEIITPQKANRAITWVCGVGLLLAVLFAVLGMDGSVTDSYGGMIVRDGFGSAITVIILIGAFLSLVFSESYLREKLIPYGEFYPLLMWATTGAIIMATSNSLLVIFVGLEILSISSYVLCGLARKEEGSGEAAIKYFLLGAFSSAFFLFGIAFYYGSTMDLSLVALRSATNPAAANLHFSNMQSVMLVIGVGMLIIGLCFKSGLVPFHQWAPDVYQGAPTNVSAFMSSVSKVAALAVFTRILIATRDFQTLWFPALFWIAIATMIVGNVAALVQKDTKRILAYSSVAHAGYVLVAILAISKGIVILNYSTILYYLLSYTLMSVGAFAIIGMLAKNGAEETSLRSLNGLWRRNPAAAVCLLILMFSMVGLPPFSGFVGKVLIFHDAVNAGLLPLAIILALCSIISAGYYLKIAFAGFASEPSSELVSIENRIATPSIGTQFVYIVSALGVILISIFYSPIISYFLK